VTESDLYIEISSLRAQLAGLKLFLDEVLEENRQLRAQQKRLDKAEQRD
jgi:regulator of replication initiation timing